MDDPLLVRRRQAACDLLGILDRSAQRQASAAHPVAQRHPLEQFHDDERRAVVDTEVVHRQECSGG